MIVLSCFRRVAAVVVFAAAAVVVLAAVVLAVATPELPSFLPLPASVWLIPH